MINNIDLTNLIGESQSSNELTKEQFFNTYFSKVDLMVYLRKLTSKNKQELVVIFKTISEVGNFEVSPFVREDKAGSLYKMLRLRKARGTSELKLVLGGKIDQFIDDYIDGKISPKFTLVELVEAAKAA
ncbi:hypothetical protein C3K47_08795 [Solitalea longa]|uniref:Uncharacterized protein n=1 Tax=Solitalea longa TaxID=2079460 RepID=A0A2S5A3M5_9SPHI|nr:hypothetical protein [Solitalea longa]POY37145.1 hypothetical protein C3K47_08795 [Solitalea longa]